MASCLLSGIHAARGANCATSVLCGVTVRSGWKPLRVKTLEMAACLGLVGMVSVSRRALDYQQTVAAHPDNWTVALIVSAR